MCMTSYQKCALPPDFGGFAQLFVDCGVSAAEGPLAVPVLWPALPPLPVDRPDAQPHHFPASALKQTFKKVYGILLK